MPLSFSRPPSYRFRDPFSIFRNAFSRFRNPFSLSRDPFSLVALASAPIVVRGVREPEHRVGVGKHRSDPVRGVCDRSQDAGHRGQVGRIALSR